MTTLTVDLNPAHITAFAEHMRDHEGIDAPLPVLESAVVRLLEYAVTELANDPNWTRRHFWYRWEQALEAAEQKA